MKKDSDNHLLRALGLTALIIYGVGDILGAGIYSVIGKIAGHAGPLTWLSFAISMFIVLFTALSYSELSSRYPFSGGVSIYIQEAFNHKALSTFAGILLFCATILSMSTLSQAFVGYIKSLGFDFPKWIGIFGFFLILLLINVRGIRQSSIANIISTAVEVSGLLIVLVCGFLYLLKSDFKIIPTEHTPSISDILKGAALAFFAFTGFEDLANVAEEVKSPQKNLPRAMLSSLSCAGLLYLAVAWMATAILPGSILGQSDAPLVAVVTKAYPPLPIYIFSIIAIFAVFNTTLLNYITASRLLYGMSKTNLLPQFLQAVHSKYHTPYAASFLIFPIVLILGITGTLSQLASATSAIVLTVFSLSCLALIKIKLKHKKTRNIFCIPIAVPFIAIILNLSIILFLPKRNILLAVIFIMITLLITAIAKFLGSRRLWQIN